MEQAVVRVEGLVAAVGMAAVETADLVAVPVAHPLRLTVQRGRVQMPDDCNEVIATRHAGSVNRNSAL